MMSDYTEENRRGDQTLRCRRRPSANDYIAAAPRISVQAFCETSDTAAAIESAGDDRRLAKAHLTVKMGGMAAAFETYHNAPTPNVIVLESGGQSDLADLARRARHRLRSRHPRHRRRQ